MFSGLNFFQPQHNHDPVFLFAHNGTIELTIFFHEKFSPGTFFLKSFCLPLIKIKWSLPVLKSSTQVYDMHYCSINIQLLPILLHMTVPTPHPPWGRVCGGKRVWSY